MFKRRRKSAGLWTAPQGLTTQRQQLVRSVPFVFDGNQAPAISFDKVPAQGAGRVNLEKGYKAATQALDAVGMPGLRMKVIVLVDDSGSMWDEFEQGLVQKMLVRFLGFGLNVVPDGKIQVITYGRPGNIIQIDASNYQNAPKMLNPTFGSTPMTEAYEAALALAETYDMLTEIVNLTDGNPNDRVTMSNAVIRSSGYPVILKNLAIKSVPYLEEIDDLPSYYEIRKDPDTEAPVLDPNGDLIIDINPKGLRLVDNVDSKALDPVNATDAEFAAALADEIPSYLEVAGKVGLLTGVPGADRTFF